MFCQQAALVILITLLSLPAGGCHVWDEDGNDYIDYLIGSGPMLLGHGHPEVLEAVLRQLPKGGDLLCQ